MARYMVTLSTQDKAQTIHFKVEAESHSGAVFMAGKFVAAADIMGVTSELPGFCDLTDPATTPFLNIISKYSFGFDNVHQV